MKTIWILLLITNSCWTTKTEVKGYATELECQQAQSKYVAESDFATSVRAYCSSADTLLQQTKGEINERN